LDAKLKIKIAGASNINLAPFQITGRMTNDLTTYQKISYGLVLIGIVIMIAMPDVVIGLLFELAISSLR